MTVTGQPFSVERILFATDFSAASNNAASYAAARVHADLIVLGAHKDWSWLTPADRGIVPSVWARANCPILTAC
jgi:hypothetical protein